MSESIDPRTTAPFTYPRSLDDPDEIDAPGLVAQCEVLKAKSEIVGYRTTLVLKQRETGIVITVCTYSEEGYAWAFVKPETRDVNGEETEESDTVYGFEEAVLRAEDAAEAAAKGAL